MTALASAFAEQTTLQSTTNTSYEDVSGAAIASGSFTAGKKYLLIFGQAVGSSSSTALTSIQAVHGTTAFAESEAIIRPNGSGLFIQNAWWTIWEAVSSEGIKNQFKTSASTGRADNMVLIAVKLSDDLTENTDWFYAERANDDSIVTTAVTGAAVTFTPANANEKWLILSNAQIQHASTTVSVGSRLVDVNTGSGTAIPCQSAVEASDTTEISQHCFAYGCTLPASEQTFEERSYSVTSNSGTRLHSKVFAIRLAKFAQSVFAYTEAGTNLSATDYATNAQTASISPAIEGPVLIIGNLSFDRENAGRELEARLQVDDADQPDTQTADNYQFYAGRDARDEFSFFTATLETLSAAAHTIDLDASADSATGTPQAKDRCIVAFTLELAAAGGTSVGHRIIGGGWGGRTIGHG